MSVNYNEFLDKLREAVEASQYGPRQAADKAWQALRDLIKKEKAP